jgi:hypothetical protein
MASRIPYFGMILWGMILALALLSTTLRARQKRKRNKILGDTAPFDFGYADETFVLSYILLSWICGLLATYSA